MSVTVWQTDFEGPPQPPRYPGTGGDAAAPDPHCQPPAGRATPVGSGPPALLGSCLLYTDHCPLGAPATADARVLTGPNGAPMGCITLELMLFSQPGVASTASGADAGAVGAAAAAGGGGGGGGAGAACRSGATTPASFSSALWDAEDGGWLEHALRSSGILGDASGAASGAGGTTDTSPTTPTGIPIAVDLRPAMGSTPGPVVVAAPPCPLDLMTSGRAWEAAFAHPSPFSPSSAASRELYVRQTMPTPTQDPTTHTHRVRATLLERGRGGCDGS